MELDVPSSVRREIPLINKIVYPESSANLKGPKDRRHLLCYKQDLECQRLALLGDVGGIEEYRVIWLFRLRLGCATNTMYIAYPLVCVARIFRSIHHDRWRLTDGHGRCCRTPPNKPSRSDAVGNSAKVGE